MSLRRPPERPLDPLPSLKLKLGVVIALAVATTVVVFWAGIHLGLWPSASGVIAGSIALGIVWRVARGMTSPLREMADATKAMARGDYDRRVTATSRDEIGDLARSFNRMAEQLAETDRIRRDLVANVSHELRTPITALRAKLENMLDGVEPADPATLETMLSQVERLGRLVTQLLDLSRLESGAVPLDRRPFEVEPMLRHVCREAELQRGDVRLVVEVDPPDLALDGDAERLHQVMANLVENAVRHSPRDAAVTLAAHRAGTAVVFEVADEGPGIPAGDAERVFERFYRADAARSSRDGGAGLGLAIAQWIVDLHDGDIRPEVVEPHGCRMVVTIPGAVDRPAPVPVPTG